MQNIYKFFMLSAVVHSFSLIAADISAPYYTDSDGANSDSGYSSTSPDISLGTISPSEEKGTNSSDFSDYDSELGNSSGQESETIETVELRSGNDDLRRRLKRMEACRNLPKKITRPKRKGVREPLTIVPPTYPSDQTVETPRVYPFDSGVEPGQVTVKKVPSRRKTVKSIKHYRRSRKHKESLSLDAQQFLNEHPNFLQLVVNKYFSHPSPLIAMDEAGRKAHYDAKLTEMGNSPNITDFLRQTVNMGEIWEYLRYITKIELSQHLESFRKEELLFFEEEAEHNRGYIKFVAEHLVNMINATPLEVKQFFYEMARKSETIDYPGKSEEYDCFMFSLTSYFLYVMSPLLEKSLRHYYWVFEHELIKELNQYLKILKNQYDVDKDEKDLIKYDEEELKKYNEEKSKKYNEIFDNMSSMSGLLNDMQRRANVSNNLYIRQMKLVRLLQISFNEPSETSRAMNFSNMAKTMSQIFYNPVVPQT